MLRNSSSTERRDLPFWTQRPKVSVVIPTKDREEDLIECVRTIVYQSLKPLEIIVIDGGSSDTLESNLRDLLSGTNIQLVYTRQRGSFTGREGTTTAKSEGIKLSRGDIILFLDDDVILGHDYINCLIEVYTNQRDVVGVCGCGCIADTTQRRRGIVESLKAAFSYVFLLDSRDGGKVLCSGFNTSHSGLQEEAEVDWLRGCNMSYRREVFAEFDFDVSSFCEDLDLSYRVSRRHKLVATPKARLYHKFSPASRISPRIFYSLQTVGRFQFFCRNVRTSIRHMICFTWASIGWTLGHVVLCITGKADREAILGILEGNLRIFRYSFENVVKQGGTIWRR